MILLTFALSQGKEISIGESWSTAMEKPFTETNAKLPLVNEAWL